MVGASSIGFYAEPANPRRVNELKSESSEQSSTSLGGELAALTGQDDIQLSPAARGLAAAAQLMAEQEEPNQLRLERLDQIRQSLEQGTHRVQDVVLQVAARVARYVE